MALIFLGAFIAFNVSGFEFQFFGRDFIANDEWRTGGATNRVSSKNLRLQSVLHSGGVNEHKIVRNLI